MWERIRIVVAVGLIFGFIHLCYSKYYGAILEEARHANGVEISKRNAKIAILEGRHKKYREAVGSCENFIIARDRQIKVRRSRKILEDTCRAQLQSCIDIVAVKKFEDALQ